MTSLFGLLAGHAEPPVALTSCHQCGRALASCVYSAGGRPLCAGCAVRCGADLQGSGPVLAASTDAGLLTSLLAGARPPPEALAARWGLVGPWYERHFQQHPWQIKHLAEPDGTVELRFQPGAKVVRASPTSTGYALHLAAASDRPAAPHSELFDVGSLISAVLAHGAVDPSYAAVFPPPPAANPLEALAVCGADSVGSMVARVAAADPTVGTMREYVAAKHAKGATDTAIAALLLRRPDGLAVLESLYGTDTARVIQSVQVSKPADVYDLPKAVATGHSAALPPPPYHYGTPHPTQTMVLVRLPAAAKHLWAAVDSSMVRHGPLRTDGAHETYAFTELSTDPLAPFRAVDGGVATVALAGRSYGAGDVVDAGAAAWTTWAPPNVVKINADLIALVAIAAGDVLVTQVSAAEAAAHRKRRHLPPDTGAFAAAVGLALEARCAVLAPLFPGSECAVERAAEGYAVKFMKK